MFMDKLMLATYTKQEEEVRAHHSSLKSYCHTQAVLAPFSNYFLLAELAEVAFM
jgi:hypothetical protein